MAKGLVALLVLLALVGGAYLYLSAPSRRICLVMGDICHGKQGKRGHYDEFFACVDEAQNCAEGITCMAGVTTTRQP